MASRLIEWVLQVKDETGPALDGAAEGAENAADKLDDLTESQADAEKAAGRSKEVMEGFATALDQVSPAAGAAVRGVGALTGGMKSAAAATGASLTILGPLTAAIGLLGGTYLLLKKNLDEATAAQERANAKAKEAMAIGRQVEIQKLREAAQIGEITEAELNLRLARFAASDVFGEWIAAEEDALRSREALLTKLESQASATERDTASFGAFRAGGSNLRAMEEASTRARDAQNAHTASIEAANGSIETQRVKVDNLRAAQERFVQSLVVTSSAQTAATTATETGGGGTSGGDGLADELDAQRAAWESLAAMRVEFGSEEAKILSAAQDYYSQILDIEEALEGVAGAEEKIAELQEQITEWTERQLEALEAVDRRQDALIRLAEIRSELNQDTISEEDAIRDEYERQMMALNAIERSLRGVQGAEESLALAREAANEQYKRDMDALEEQERAARARAEEERRASRLSAAQGAVGFAQAGISGGAAGIAGNLGPIGDIVAAVLGILESVGSLGAQGIGDRLEQTNENIVKGIRELPELIGEVLPEVVSEFLEALILALSETADDLVVAIIEGTIDAAAFVVGQLPRILIEAFGNLINDILTRIFPKMFGRGGEIPEGFEGMPDTGGDFGTTVFTDDKRMIEVLGSKDSGAMSIDRTGLYVVHQGEQIIQNNGRGTQSAGGGTTMGGGVQVVTTGVVAPGFMDLLSDAIREAQARGLVFG